MARLYLRFAKRGYIRYTSHLDLLRLFKRAFKRTGVPLAYSQGYNPHPKMSFAQPLSLGYTAEQEFLEFYTYEDMPAEEILARMAPAMPEGLELSECRILDMAPKSMAAVVTGAEYSAALPASAGVTQDALSALIGDYLAQPEIVAMKKMKKTKRLEPVDIKPMIRSMRAIPGVWAPEIAMELDSGSASNLSPELVLQTFLEKELPQVHRYDVEVCRKYLLFDPCIPHMTGVHLDHSKSKEGSEDEKGQAEG